MTNIVEQRRKRSRGNVTRTQDGSAYESDEIEFMFAVEQYKRALGRHLDCRDILEVALRLGYRKEGT